MIDPRLGTVIIYKSKKRMELRLSKECLDSEQAVEIYRRPK